MANQPFDSISARGVFGPRADMGPLGLICHAIWILACIILYIYMQYIMKLDVGSNKEAENYQF
jgi:hypothetical protein